MEYLDRKKCAKCKLVEYRDNDTLKSIRIKKKLKYGSELLCSISYYSNGNVKCVQNYKKDVKSGVYKYFWQNGKLKERGTYKKALQEGKWKYYDSLNNKVIVKNYYKGNMLTDSIKYNFYYTYGLPAFRGVEYDNCRKEIMGNLYQIKYIRIAGCCVSNYQERIANKQSRKVDKKMIKRFGIDWEMKMDEEIRQHCSNAG